MSLLVTAGLGMFWVANRHLPVFDWRCLFGYATVLLVVVNLAFNFRVPPTRAGPGALQRSRADTLGRERARRAALGASAP